MFQLEKRVGPFQEKCLNLFEQQKTDCVCVCGQCTRVCVFVCAREREREREEQNMFSAEQEIILGLRLFKATLLLLTYSYNFLRNS